MIDVWRRQEGSIALELVFVAPAMILLLLLIAVGGKIMHAKGQVQGAARDAARAASLSRATASDDAEMAARQTLDGKLACINSDIIAPISASQPGTQVTATATCVVDVSTLGLPGFPGVKTLTATVVAPVDTHVGR